MVERFSDDDVVGALGATNLCATSRKAGVLRRDTLTWRSSLALSAMVSDTELELWGGGREPRQVAAVPWSEVDDVGGTDAALSSAGPRPVATVLLGNGYLVCVVPLHRVGGVVLGSVGATQLLIDVLRAHLDAYDAPVRARARLVRRRGP